VLRDALAESYDPAGNELGDGVSTFGYSPRELLGSDSAFIAAYYYDGFRQRVATQIKSTSGCFFDQSMDLIAETAQFASGSPQDELILWRYRCRAGAPEHR
jgi:hypothetical protein